MIKSFSHALKAHDKRHYMSATFDTVGSVIGILITTLIVGLMSSTSVEMNEIAHSLIMGVLRGTQYYFGTVTIVSVLGMLVNTFSPYRYVISSLFLTAIMVFISISRHETVGFNPEDMGLLITLCITSYISGSHLVNILFRESQIYATLCATQSRRSSDHG